MGVVAAIGDLIGAYRLERKLGSGGMGDVWLAIHERLNREVALKMLRPEVSQSTDVVERFFDEARAAASITDPGIVHIYDFGWHGERAYIAMELLHGESLAQRIRNGPSIEPRHAVELMHQLAVTIEAAHRLAIVHRDLKPENLFIVPDPVVPGGERIKVLDFGVAKLPRADVSASPRTLSGAILGTPSYMSPEQCRGAADIDQRTDVYAIGCILYELLCGRPPFIGASSADVIASQLLEAPTPPSAHQPVDGAVEQIVMRCLAKDPGGRYPSMAELADQLAAALERLPAATPTRRTRPVVDSPPAAFTTTLAAQSVKLAPPPSRRRTVMLAAGATLVLVVVAVAWWTLWNRSDPPLLHSPAGDLPDRRLHSDAAIDRAIDVVGVSDGAVVVDSAIDAVVRAGPPDAPPRPPPRDAATTIGRDGGPASTSPDAYVYP